jgi:small GTP-binding protein
MASHISIKFLVVGDENVGKTTIINYFTLVPVKAVSTVGIDFQSRIVALSAEGGKQEEQQQEQQQQQQDNEKNKTKINEKNDNPGNRGNNRRSQYSSPSKSAFHSQPFHSQPFHSESETLLLSTMKVGAAHDTVHSRIRHTDYDYVKCCFWDTSGSPNYQCLAQTYYTGVAAVIVVFDLSSQHSYNGVNSYISRVIQKNNCNHSHPILVLGNKLDQRSISFTKRQVFEALCFDFPHENIRYEEVSCLDKPVSVCAGCANSSDIHVVLTSFIQSLYDTVVKPHYYNPLAITYIDCRGISGSSRFFKEKVVVKDRGWSWRGNYTSYIRDSKDADNNNKNNRDNNNDYNKRRHDNSYVQMANLKSPRECCSEQGLERVSSCTSGCSIM